MGIYDSSAIWSKELIAAFLFPLWASNTERITSLSMLGNMSWIDFRSSSLHRCWGLTAGGGIATGIMSGLQTAGIPAHTKKIQHKHVRKINDSEEESGSSLPTNPPTSAFIFSSTLEKRFQRLWQAEHIFLELDLCPSYVPKAIWQQVQLKIRYNLY